MPLSSLVHLYQTLRFVITSRESSLALFLSVSPSCTSKVEWSFFYSKSSWDLSTSVCVREDKVFSFYLLFLLNSYFWKSFFFPCGHFFCFSSSRAMEMEGLSKSTSNCFSLVNAEQYSFPVLQLSHVSFSMLDFCVNCSKSSLISLPILR